MKNKSDFNLLQNIYFALAMIAAFLLFMKIGTAVALILNINSYVMQLISVIISCVILQRVFSLKFRGFWNFPNVKTFILSVVSFLPIFVIRIQSLPKTNTVPFPIIVEIVCMALVEEILFRGVVCSLGMRSIHKRSSILKLVRWSGILFGLAHIMNINAGQGVLSTTLQILSATETGILYSLIFIFNGSIWPTAILHSVNNLICYARYQTFIVEMSEYGLTWWKIVLLIMMLFEIIMLSGLILRKNRLDYVRKLWQEKWDRNE